MSAACWRSLTDVSDCRRRSVGILQYLVVVVVVAVTVATLLEPSACLHRLSDCLSV